jgi:transposase
MNEIRIIGIDLTKHVFQLHGAKTDGTVAFRRKLRRGQVLAFLAGQPRCVVAMEACASAHHWGREIEALAHEARPIAPAYV